MRVGDYVQTARKVKIGNWSVARGQIGQITRVNGDWYTVGFTPWTVDLKADSLILLEKRSLCV